MGVTLPFDTWLREDDLLALPTGVIEGDDEESPQPGLHPQWKWRVM